MQVLQCFDSVGRSENTTVATTVTKQVLSSATSRPAFRQGVNITNHDATATLYVKAATSAASAPTISTTNHHWSVGPEESIIIAAGLGVSLWIESDSAGDVTYTAVELL